MLKKDPKLKTITMERYVMTRVKSPFNLKLYCIFQNPTELDIVMPFLKGGDLRYYLKEHGPMNEIGARFYSAEILIGLKELHSLRVVHRDLKPENLMFRETGHICITDYGISKKLSDKFITYGRAGTLGYSAPEVEGREYSFSCDIYTFAIILYEFLMGHRPNFPNVNYHGLSEDVVDLLKSLLKTEVTERLGGGQSIDAVMNHKFYSSIDWDAMTRLEVKAPFIPDPDVANCSNLNALEEALLGDDVVEPLSEEEQALFKDLSYRDHLKKKDSIKNNEDDTVEGGKKNASIDLALRPSNQSATFTPHSVECSSPRSVVDFINENEATQSNLITPDGKSAGKTWNSVDVDMPPRKLQNQI